jgi:UDP-glucose:(heptosyl)LPS alpha-1,3-glucosyltransferase
LLERLPARAMLVVVGDNSRRSLPELEPLAARLEDQGRLRFVGQREDVWRFDAAADALLFPSLYESFGLVLLEALAAGLPVVTARTVALADDLIRDGENGFIVDHPWDVEGMALRIERLMRDPELGRRLGERARAPPAPNPGGPHPRLGLPARARDGEAG